MKTISPLLFPLLLCIFMYSCTGPHEPQSNIGNLNLSLSVFSSQVRISRFSISNLRLFDADGRQILLESPPMLIEWHNNETIPLHLISLDIPAGVYSEFAMDIAVNNDSFLFHDKEATKNLALIDALNNEIRLRIEPFTIKTDIVGEKIKVESQSTYYLNVNFDVDRSVRPLIQDNTGEPISIALFKPFLTVTASNKRSDNQYIAIHNSVTSNTLRVRHSLSGQIITIPFSHIQSSTINQVVMPWSDAINYFSNHSGTQVRITDKGGIALDILPQENKLIFLEGIVSVDGAGEVEIDSILVSNLDASPEAEFLNNLNVNIYTPSGELAGNDLNSLFNGQPFRGYLVADTLHVHLLNADLIAIIKDESPLIVSPLSFHDTPIMSTIEMLVKSESLNTMKKGNLIKLNGYAFEHDFHMTNVSPVDVNNVEYGLVLPSTLDANPVVDIINGSLLVLDGKNEIAQRSLKIAGTAISHNLGIDYIELQNASISLYSDRYTDGNRLYHYDSLEQAFDALKGHLLNAHHLNEIHARGRMENNILIAEEVSLVIYGFSILDAVNTHDVILSLEDEEVSSASTSTKPRTAITLGLTLGIGLPLATAGLIFLAYQKNMLFLQGRPNGLRSGADSRGVNLKPLYSSADKQNSARDGKLKAKDGKLKAKDGKLKANESTKKTLTVKTNKDNSINLGIQPKKQSVTPEVISGLDYDVVTLHDTNETISIPKKETKPLAKEPLKNLPTITEEEELTENDVIFKKTTLDNGHIYKTVKGNLSVPDVAQPIIDASDQDTLPATTSKGTQLSIVGYYSGDPVYLQNNKHVQLFKDGEKNMFFELGESEVTKISASQLTSMRVHEENPKPFGVFDGVDLYIKGGQYYIRNVVSGNNSEFVHISTMKAHSIIDAYTEKVPSVTEGARLITYWGGGSIYFSGNQFYLFEQDGDKSRWAPITKQKVRDLKNDLKQSLAQAVDEKVLVHTSTEGHIYKIENKLFLEVKKNKQVNFQEVTEVDRDSETGERLFIPATSATDDMVKLNLDDWYRKKYPEEFKNAKDGSIWFNDVEVTDLLQDRAMIDTELASNYLDGFNKKNKNILFLPGRVDNPIDMLYGAGVIIANKIALQDENLKTMQYDAQARINDLYNSFKASDKKYGIFPVLGGGQHFNALVLVKIKENNQESIRSILIEPATGYKKGGTFKDTLDLLPKKYGAPIALQAGIQVDGCSCGPISLVTATDTIKKIINSKMSPENINQAGLENIINELKSTEKYAPEDQHPRLRLEVLKMLDNAPNRKPVLTDSPLYDAHFKNRIQKK